MQTDPIRYAGGSNLYAYVGNDPLNLTDPVGLSADVLSSSNSANSTPREAASGPSRTAPDRSPPVVYVSDSPLQRLHPDSTYQSDLGAQRSLDYWRQQSTEDIVRSLSSGAREPLQVKPDGTIMDGNTRIKALEERGYPINTLPRQPYISPPDNGPGSSGGNGAGGGGVNDQCACIPNGYPFMIVPSPLAPGAMIPIFPGVLAPVLVP